MDAPREAGWWFPATVFVASVVAFMPLALFGLRTYLAVDLNTAGFPYDALSADIFTRPTLQTDQVEWLPWLVSFWDEVRGGNFPLWSHEIAGGSPHGTLPFLGTMSPFNLGFAFLPAWYAVGFGVALTLLCGQWGMYLLCRRLGTSMVPATVAGVAYGYTGTYLALVHRITAIVLAPLLLWAVLRLFDRVSGRRVAILGALITCTWLAGFPSGFVYSVYLVAVFVLWLAVADLIRGRPRSDVLRTLGGAAAAGVLGVLASAVTLLPFISETLGRDTLEDRVWGSSDHMPTLNLFGVFDQTLIGDADRGPWFADWNPIETSSQVGFIVLTLAALGLGAAAAGRLKIMPGNRATWSFFVTTAVVTTILVWIGTPLLGLVYRVPGLGDGPIQRIRYFLPLSVIPLGALAVDGFWRSNSVHHRLTPAPRLISGIGLVLLVAFPARYALDYWQLVNDNGQRRNVAVAVLAGVALSFVAIATIAWCRDRRSMQTVGGLVVVALVFFQAWYPFRDLTPQADPDLFYTSTAAHETVGEFTNNESRFLAPGVVNFYPNGSQVTGLLDLRGVTIYAPEMKRLVEVASPDAFLRDPFKITSIADEWDFASPALDRLAVSTVALALDQPIGLAPPNEDTFAGYLPTDQIPPPGLTRTAPGAFNGLSLPLLQSGSCDDVAWSITLLSEGRELDRFEGWAADLDEGWESFVLDGTSLNAGDEYELLLDLPFTAKCELAVGIESTLGPGPAIGHWLVDPEAPLQLVATDEAAIYRRPAAKQFVTATTSWQVVASDLAAIEAVRNDQAPAVVATDQTPSATDRASATVTSFELIDDGVNARVSADAPALVVVAQHLAGGWVATVDGEQADLVQVDGALTGLFVEPGDHLVELRYRPNAFAWGWKISAVAAAALAALGLRRERSDDLGQRQTEIT